jgi:hypothetical protein
VLRFEELLNGDLVWSGKYGASMICDGIQSIIMTFKQISDESDDLKFIIAEQNLTDIKMFLVDFKCETRAIDNPYTSDVLEQCILETDSINFFCDSSKLKCKLCPKKFVKKKMRNHIGLHILHGDCGQHPHRCGYCGEVGCTIGLEITSGYGNKTVYGPKSDCSYYTDISKRAENKFVKSYPCSNRPVICEQCQDCYWSYNLTEHYKIKHAGIMCPNQIPEEERKHMLSKKS